MNNGSTIKYISINVLKVHPRNQEFFDDISGKDYEQFKASIKEEGIISEIIVAQDMTILSGHQRYKAAKELGFTEVPVRIMDDVKEGDDNRKLKILLAANFGRYKNDQRKQDKVAAEYVALCGYKPNGDRATEVQNGLRLTLDEIAAQLGTTKSSLKRSIRIERDLSEPMKKLLDDGVISRTVAADIIATLPENEQIDLVANLDATKKYTSKEIEQIKKTMQSKTDKIQKEKNTLASKLKDKEDEIDYLLEQVDKLGQTDDNVVGDVASDVENNLRQERDNLLKQQELYKEEIAALKRSRFSEPAQEADTAYDFSKAITSIIQQYTERLIYSDFFQNNVNNTCETMVVKSCKLMIDFCNDVLKRQNLDDVVDVVDII